MTPPDHLQNKLTYSKTQRRQMFNGSCSAPSQFSLVHRHWNTHFPAEKNKAICCTSSAPDIATATQHATVPQCFYLSLSVSKTGCHTYSTLVACHPWARNSIWRSTASQTTTGAGEEKMMTYLTGQITFKRMLHPKLTILSLFTQSHFVLDSSAEFLFMAHTHTHKNEFHRFIAYNSSL